MPTFAPAHAHAQQFGVKCIVFGPPGSGKTPLIDTAPRPVLLAVEPGLLSMRNSNTPCCLAPTVALVQDFFRWLFSSREADQYDTVGIDSISEISSIVLQDELKKHKDPRKAYGELAKIVFEPLNSLYYMRTKHAYLIAKETRDDDGKRIPQFEGQWLKTEIPHKYDEILHLGKTLIPNVGEVTALRTREAHNVLARDRSGKLAEFEQPHLGQLFNKIIG